MEIVIRNSTQALEAVLAFLQKYEDQDISWVGPLWQEKTLFVEGIPDMVVTGKLFTSGDWKVEVAQGVAPISRTIYRVTVFNPGLRKFWKGSVKADGNVTEETGLKVLSEMENLNIEEEFTRKAQVSPPQPGGYGH